MPPRNPYNLEYTVSAIHGKVFVLDAWPIIPVVKGMVLTLEPLHSHQPPPLPSGYLCRSPRGQDAQNLWRMGRVLLAQTPHFVRSPVERGETAQEFAQVIEYFSRMPGHEMINIWHGDSPVAEAALTPGTLIRTAHSASLGMGILKDHWHKGLGQHMAQVLEVHAHKNGVERLELTVFASNHRARDFYHRLGYSEEGIKRRSVRFPSTEPAQLPWYEDEVLMSKWIGPDGI